MKVCFLITSYLFLFFAISPATHAAYIKCWKNKQNIRECSKTVPPEYAQQRIEVINDQGIVVKIIQPRKTKNQLAEDARKAKKQQAREEQRRQDLILLKSFTTEKDLLLSRDKKLATIDGTITIANGNLRILNSSLEQLQKQAANHERAGSPIPRPLIVDIDSVKSQVLENEKYVLDKQNKRKELKEKFAADLARYRQLKQVKPR